MSANHLLNTIRKAVAAGIDWIQVREKDLPARELFELSQKSVAAAAKTPTKIFVNDRLDAALAAGAAGVHLGGESVPVAAVSRRREAGRLPSGFLIGVSCHSLEEALAAEGHGADHIFFGPVFATPSKLAFGAPQGLDKLAQVCRAVKIPVLAIGGVDADTARECFAAGAAGIAAIRMFQRSSDLAGLIAKIPKRS